MDILMNLPPKNFLIASLAVLVVGMYMNLLMLLITWVPTRTYRPKFLQSTQRMVIGGQYNSLSGSSCKKCSQWLNTIYNIMQHWSINKGIPNWFVVSRKPGIKNLPASQERKRNARKKTMAELYDTNTKHKLLAIL